VDRRGGLGDFTIPGEAGQDDYLVLMPVLLLAAELGGGRFGFVVTLRPDGHRLSLFTEAEYAWRALAGLDLPGATPFRLDRVSRLRDVLGCAARTSAATHVAIDAEAGNPRAGRVCPLPQIIALLGAALGSE
jgi:hypothetical protein